MTHERWRLLVTGVVQGVGFRPFVYAEANAHSLTGWITNSTDGVLVEVQGHTSNLERFRVALLTQAPTMSDVQDLVVEQVPVLTESDFTIRASSVGEGTTSLPSDTAVCENCLREMRETEDRRFGYPFIACTHCGPRYTIVTGLPYDRDHTTMVDFPMCSMCQAEYQDPTSRRFHAQPTACPVCGPSMSMDVAEIVDLLGVGRIGAIKGLGGYHLACDARNADAVAELRRRKQRGDKPFAVMAADLSTARALVHLDEHAEELLTSAQRPIVIAPAIDHELAQSIAPGNSTIGVMLPYAPLHHLLFDAGAPSVLVMTSGNLSDEPICIDESEAVDRLSAVADFFCHHNRRIHVACDDSVISVGMQVVQPIRRSRGYAPAPFRLPLSAPAMLAVGGELKATIGLARGQTAWLSQHIGDTTNFETMRMLERTVATMCEVQRVDPEVVVSDLHPGYLSRAWAQDWAVQRGVEYQGVQHHHAHAASLLVEHERTEPVIAFAFDGTGYGSDGQMWGGEALIASLASAERIGHLAQRMLPGGDAATDNNYRIALAHLHAAGEPWQDLLPPVAHAGEQELTVLARMLETGTGCTATTSVGRLFDAISALLGIRQQVEYEGQAAIELEAWASQSDSSAAWLADVHDDLTIDPSPMVRAAVRAAITGTPRADAARAFHLGLAHTVAVVAERARERWGIGTVGLTGGVFSNAVLTWACRERLGAAGFSVLTHQRVPANDGGLALGQLAVVTAQREGKE